MNETDRPIRSAHEDIARFTRRSATRQEHSKALWAMTGAQRVIAMRCGRLTMNQCIEWAQRRPHEVPRLNGEYEFIAISTPEIADRRQS